ncbi:putative quinol monooxygenase [Brevibacterium sp. FAM 24638]|uniref:putative quinol monooxygenase n=1 Tax=Brevibacterium sp. FAM 24638 TaxID=3415681 RepID=UPI003C79F53B
MTVTTLATYTCAPGERDEILSIIEPARTATIAEQGCQYFIVLAPMENRDQIVLIEGWNSTDDLAAHRRTAHFTETILGTVAHRVVNRTVNICDQLSTSTVHAASPN